MVLFCEFAPVGRVQVFQHPAGEEEGHIDAVPVGDRAQQRDPVPGLLGPAGGQNVLDLVEGHHQPPHQQLVTGVEGRLKRGIGTLGAQC